MDTMSTFVGKPVHFSVTIYNRFYSRIICFVAAKKGSLSFIFTSLIKKIDTVIVIQNDCCIRPYF